MIYHNKMSTWAQIAKHEEAVAPAQKTKSYPFGWVRLYRDKNNTTVIEQHENDPYLQEKEVDLDDLMGKAIRKMRARWEMHHYLAGTFYDYDIEDDLDDYESDEEVEESDSDEEQNVHLVGGGYYAEE